MTTGRGGTGRDAPTVFLSAGESSGDLHGARLASELRDRIPDIRMVGLGGSRMRAAGVDLLADLDTLAVMGLTEVARKLPRLLLLWWRVRRRLAAGGIDLVIPIDYPGFNLRLACRARSEGIPVLYYIAPQVWAWRRGRARRLAECTDRVCVILPFEEEFLGGYGADVRFVGHPLLDEEGDTGREGEARATAGSSGVGPPVLGLFPGSRRQEVERMLPPFLEAADRLRRRRELRVVVARAPDLPRELYPPGSVDVRPFDEVLGMSTAALTKSGTVTLQLALAGVPMVVAYRMNRFTHWVARRMVEVEHMALVNLVAGRRLVPELLQDDVTPDGLARLAEPFLEETDVRRRVEDGLARVRGRLGEPGCAARVTEEAVELIHRETA